MNEVEVVEIVPNNYGVKLREFEQLIQASALKFALKLSSNMSIPRKFVYDSIGDYKEYMVTAYMEGIKNVIVPLLVEDKDKDVVEGFIQIGSSAFCNVETEWKFDSMLRDSDFVRPVIKFPIGVQKEKFEDKRTKPKKRCVTNFNKIKTVNIVVSTVDRALFQNDILNKAFRNFY